MAKYTFEFSVLEKEGKRYYFLTANEYPWMNCQVVPTPDELREKILEKLYELGGHIYFSEGRKDFCVIQAGGGTEEHPTIEINNDNFHEVAQHLRDCSQAAADYWAKNGDKLLKKYNRNNQNGGNFGIISKIFSKFGKKDCKR